MIFPPSSFLECIIIIAWLFCIHYLLIIFIKSAKLDLKQRYIDPVYFKSFWILAFVPGLIVMAALFLAGHVFMIILNFVIIIICYSLGKFKCIGGSDARCLICISWIAPFAYPAVIIMWVALMLVKIVTAVSNTINDDYETNGIPFVFYLMICYGFFLVISDIIVILRFVIF